MSEQISDLKVFRDNDIEEVETYTVEEENGLENLDTIELWKPLVNSQKSPAFSKEVKTYPYITALGIILWVITHK